MQTINALDINDANAWDLPLGASVADNPLLGSLMALTQMHSKSVSGATITAGFPLVDHRLTPELFIRVALRAAFSSSGRWTRFRT